MRITSMAILFLVFGLSFQAIGQYDDKISKARSIANELMHTYPGLTIAVGVGDELVWKEGFGLADITENEPVTPKHQFRLYSLSKSITGMALSKLIDEGKLDIEQSVRVYLKDLPDHYKSVRVKHLINHTAGVRHYKKGEWMKISQDHCTDTRSAIKTFIDDPLISTPGEKYKYSSFGYVLLSRLLSEVAGQSYNDFVRAELFEPLGITNIRPDKSEGIEHEVIYYEKWNAKSAKARESVSVDNSCKFGGGGFVGTAEDLVILHLAMLNTEIVSTKATERYYKGLPTSAGAPTGYAFGIGDATSSAGLQYHSHSGSAVGANSVMLIYPDQRIVVVILGNLNDSEMNSRVGEIAGLFKE